MAVECTYCEEKVNANRGIYIKCTLCQDVKLCLDCFSAGATIAEHESDHPYELVDCGSFPIIDETWKAHEELALLEAIELYGIGSWADIANAVSTRSPEECCERYLRVYVENFFGRTAWNAIDRNLYTVHDHTCLYNRPLSPSLSLPEKSKIVDISREQQIKLGYMPKRDDFEREYDNEAELLVSKLAVNANDDNELDQDLKIAHINMYTDKLRERFRRKRIVLEYNLVKLFFHMHPEENSDLNEVQLQKPQEDLTDSITATANSSATPTPITAPTTVPFNLDAISSSRNVTHTTDSKKPHTESPSKHADSTATNGKTQPTILNYFRRVDPINGSSTTKHQLEEECGQASGNSILSSYFSDLNKSIAEQDFSTMENKLRIFCQFSTAESHNRLIRNIAREKELKVRIRELTKRRKNGMKFHNCAANSMTTSSDSDVASKHSPSNKKHSTRGAHTDDNEESISMDVDFDDTTSSTLTKTNHKSKNNRNESTKAIMNQQTNNSEPSWRLLSESEKKLCKSSNLKPSQYISFKTFILKVSTFADGLDGISVF